MADAWKFGPEGVEVPGAGEFKFAGQPSARELAEVGSQLQEAGNAFASLSKAMLSFETGGALYRDCLRNVLDLQAGLRESVAVLEGVYSDLGTFFEPGRSPFGRIRPDLRLKLAAELLEALSRPEKVERPEPPAEPSPAVVLG